MWYEGINLAERYGIRKTSIKTDADLDEQIDYYNDDTVEIVDSFSTKDELEESIEQDLNSAIKAGGILMEDFINKRRETESAYMDSLMRTPLGKKAYRQTYGIPDDKPVENYINDLGSNETIPDSVFLGFYDQNSNQLYNSYSDMDRTVNVTAVPEDEAFSLNDGSYDYRDYFNF